MMILGAMVVIIIFMFWPVFTGHFGIHNDYSLLSTVSADPLGFNEAKHLLMIGRFLGGFIVTWQGMLSGGIESLRCWRIVGFVLTLLAAGLLLRAGYQRGLDKRLLPLGLLGIMVLPSVHMGILWAVHVFPGAFNLLLALVSYRLFDRALEGYHLRAKPYAFLEFAGALIGVFLSLWIYFPTACAFLLMGYLKMLWPHEQERFIFLWFRDICFFTAAIVVYMLVDRMVIYQWVVSTTAVVNIDPEYTVGLSLAPWKKMHIFVDALIVSWQGLWHTFGLKARWLILSEIATFILLLIYGNCRWINFWTKLMINMVGACALVIISQLPAFLSVGMTSLKGYRVLIIPMLAFLLFKLWVIDSLSRKIMSKVAIAFSVGWLLLFVISGFSVINHCVKRHQTELLGLEWATITLRGDQNIRNVYVIPARLKNDMLRGKVLSEYNYTMNLKQHLQPAFDALCLKYQLLPNRYHLEVLESKDEMMGFNKAILVDIREILQ